jgi:hypothetical protein
VFAIPGVVLLVVVLLVRPEELGTSTAWRYLPTAIALVAGLGLTIDLRLRHTRPLLAPSLPWVLALAAWVALGLVARGAIAPGTSVAALAIVLVTYGLVAHAPQTVRAFERVAAALVVVTLAIAAIAVHEGRARFGCHRIDDGWPGRSVGIYDGRPCDEVRDCRAGGAESGAAYLCERAGLLGTHSVAGGRVRWVGPLGDPNALAMALSIGLPLVFAFAERRRRGSFWRALFVVGAIALVGLATVYTRSRSGQLVFVAATAAFFVRRLGVVGALAGAALAALLASLAGRSGDPYAPSLERIESWWVGLSLLGESPLVGVGAGQLVDHHASTAKSAVVQSAAEAGLPGLYLLTMAVWVTAKTPIALLREPTTPQPLRAWSAALLASLAALVVGMLFSAVAWDPIVWIVLGLGGALHQVARRANPNFRLSIRTRDVVGALAVDIVLLAAIALYTRAHV